MTPNFIELNGSKEMEVNVFDNYVEMGAKTKIGNFKLKSEGLVDTKKIGTYEIKYYLFNQYKVRTIKVVDNISPVITLKGDNVINLNLNQPYQELGYEVSDNYDFDLNEKVIITNNVDNTKSGKYEVKYEVLDSSNNKTEVIREIYVGEKSPLTMSTKEFNLDGYFLDTILKETEDYGNEYINETVFFGDSITFNFAYFGAIPFSNNLWAKSSIDPETAYTWPININSTVTNNTFLEILEQNKPKRVVISLGANAVSWMEIDYFINNYEKLIKKAKEVSPDTKLIVQSVFPVDSKYDVTENRNNKINKINYYLAEMCERQNIKFLNSAVVLKDENGACKKGYCYQTDGIHLEKDASMLVLDYFKTHALEKE